MAGKMTAFAFCPGSSPLHRLPAGIKLLALFALSFGAFFFGLAALLVSSIIILASSIMAGTGLARLFRGSRMLLISAALVILARSLLAEPPWFSFDGFLRGLVFLWTLLVSFSGAALFFSVTTMSELRKSTGRAEMKCRSFFSFLAKPFRHSSQERAVPQRPVLSLAISLMLGFLPRFFAVWEDSVKAYTARGGKPGLKQLYRLMLPAVERMLEAAADTARAMECRGLG